MSSPRLTYEDSCKRLQPTFLANGVIPPMPPRMPRYDDAEPLGVNFFRTVVDGRLDASNLTLPRTFFGRSEISWARFTNADLSESNLCWNDFVSVDFSDACLAHADLRASNFKDVNFASADLRGADMRRSVFSQCSFEGALMGGAVMTHSQGSRLNLSGEQRVMVFWTSDEGEEPSGG